MFDLAAELDGEDRARVQRESSSLSLRRTGLIMLGTATPRWRHAAALAADRKRELRTSKRLQPDCSLQPLHSDPNGSEPQPQGGTPATSIARLRIMPLKAKRWEAREPSRMRNRGRPPVNHHRK
jgi:hypothetical protein